MRGLDGEIETLKFLEVGTDLKKSKRSYYIVFITHFDYQEGLAAYALHPSNLPVIDTMRELSSSSVVVDNFTEWSALMRDLSQIKLCQFQFHNPPQP